MNVTLRTPDVEYLKGLLVERRRTLDAYSGLSLATDTERAGYATECKLIDGITEALEEVTPTPKP